MYGNKLSLFCAMRDVRPVWFNSNILDFYFRCRFCPLIQYVSPYYFKETKAWLCAYRFISKDKKQKMFTIMKRLFCTSVSLQNTYACSTHNFEYWHKVCEACLIAYFVFLTTYLWACVLFTLEFMSCLLTMTVRIEFYMRF